MGRHAIIPFMTQFARFRHLAIPALLCGATMMLVATAAPQSAPAGWKIVKDKKQLCQMAVPADWTPDKFMASQLHSPDGKTNALLGAKPAEATYGQIVQMAKSMFKPTQTFADTAQRTWFEETKDANKKKTSWYAAINSTPVCEVQVEFFDPSFEADAKKIVESLSKAK